MSKVSTLKDACVSLSKLRENAKKDLLNLLDDLPGSKVLYLDPTLAGPLGLIVEVNELKDHGVVSWYELGSSFEDDDGANVAEVIFFARPSVDLVAPIANRVKKLESRSTDVRFTAIFVPRSTEYCNQALKQHNMERPFRVKALPLYFIPLDSDLISLERKGSYRDYHVHGDPSVLLEAAQGLMQLEEACGGRIPNVRAVGSAAKHVCDCLFQLRREQSGATGEGGRGGGGGIAASKCAPFISPLCPTVPLVPPVKFTLDPIVSEDDDESSWGGAAGGCSTVCSPEIEWLVIIDRRVDLVTPFCTQFTYEGLLDSFFGIKNMYIEIPPSVLPSSSGSAGRSSKISVNSNDALYEEIRDLHISVLGALLHERANEIQKTYKEKENLKNIPQLTEFMQKFKHVQAQHHSLSTHVNVASHVGRLTKTDEFRKRLQIEDEIMSGPVSPGLVSKLEELIDDGVPFNEVCRLMCLASAVSNGFKGKTLDQLNRALVNMYGIQELPTLWNFECASALRRHQGKYVWEQVQKAFNLMVDESVSKDDISYVYSGYAPLSVRLVQYVHSQQNGWRSCKDALNLLWGPAMEVRQQPLRPKGTAQSPQASARIGNKNAAKAPGELEGKEKASVVLVLYLGGCTFGEVAALRRLSKMQDGKRKYVIATTDMISSSTFLDSLAEDEMKGRRDLVQSLRTPAPPPKDE